MFGRILRAAVLMGLIQAATCLAATYEVAQRNPQAADDGPGTLERPWKTLAKAAATVRAGDHVLIRDGVYRETVVLRSSGTAESPIVFEATPGAQVVVSGADRLLSWQPAAAGKPIYHLPWPHQFLGGKFMAHPDDEYHRLIGRCEQVIVDAYPLRQVLAQDQLAPGTFFVDVSNQVLSAWDAGSRDLNRVLAEASVRQELFKAEGEHIEIRGLRFRYAANMAQHGAVVLAGSHNLLEDCVVEDMNSSGATLVGEHQVVRRCVFRNNGQLGFGANGAHSLLFTECTVENNNVKGFDRGWEAGGDKLVLCRGAVLERSRFLRNHGSGIWFDIGNEQCVVRQCLIADNEDSGIFDEISFGMQARDNVIIGNGFAATAGAWGAQAGIALSSSPDSVIERNLMLGNREGFDFREQTRTTPRIGVSGKPEEPVWNHDQLIRHNVIALNRDAQIWGWFDMPDGRHWPARATSMPVKQADPSGKPGDQAAPYLAKSNAGQPAKLTLDKLHLSFDGNVYFAEPGQGGFKWGVTWGRHQSYARLEGFRAELKMDQGSREINPQFANLPALDCRVPASVFADLQSSYPEGPVPDVLLGALPAPVP